MALTAFVPLIRRYSFGRVGGKCIENEKNGNVCRSGTICLGGRKSESEIFSPRYQKHTAREGEVCEGFGLVGTGGVDHNFV